MKVGSQPRIPFLMLAAILVSFFPCGILYPFSYPVPEIATLCLWIWAFPSPVGYLSLLLLPLFLSGSYGYSSFNLFCVVATLAIGVRFTRQIVAGQPLEERLHRLLRACLVISLFLAAWQAIDGKAWLRVFPAMFALGDGRGAGLREEPSLLAPPLALYLAAVLWRRMRQGLARQKENGLVLEAATLTVATIFLTRSLSVVIVALCFLPAFSKKIRYFFICGGVGTFVVAAVLWDRVRDALSTGGTLAYIITTGVGSWRNVPDILILLNARAYLLPPNPVEIRNQINSLTLSWNPQFYWLDNTYSTFSASASTLGIVATALLFGSGVLLGLRRTSSSGSLRFAWVMLYLADWFILPKYEPCGWVALGLVTVAASPSWVRASEALPAPIAGGTPT
ncbi:MAG: hypothetical protein ACRD19_08930 [Terriglobia bacterium]